MSNFKCLHCGMINIDCGKEGYKTPREIELKKENERLKEKLKIAEKALLLILDRKGLCFYKDKNIESNCLFLECCKIGSCEKYKSQLVQALQKIKEVTND